MSPSLESLSISDLKTESEPESTLNFPNLPPFPPSTSIPTAPLLTLTLASLLPPPSQSPSHPKAQAPNISSPASQTLFEISQSLGFFYLDLRETELGTKLLEESERLFRVGEELYEWGEGEGGDLRGKGSRLQEFDFSGEGSVFGYKGLGKNFLVGEEVEGKVERDRNEFYNIAKDDLLGNSTKPFPQPPPITKNTPLLKSYTEHAHTLIQLILTHLNTHLKLPDNTLADIHDINRTSGDHIRLIKTPSQPQDDRKAALGKHTDFGSITLLFNRIGGLQVQMPGNEGSKIWHYVRPLPNHAIINLGDAMVKFTNGLLRSNIHRVVAPPGEQAECTRYSLVYFVRPADEVLLRSLDREGKGGVIPALREGVVEDVVDSRTWIRNKALGRREGVWKGVEAEDAGGLSTERVGERRAVVV